MSAPIDDREFEALASASRDLHGHTSVLPVAIWIMREQATSVSVSEVLRGLSGRLDRPRIVEALARLEAIGAMKELPRSGPKNAPRFFDRNMDSPYWGFAATYDRGRAPVGG